MKVVGAVFALFLLSVVALASSRDSALATSFSPVYDVSVSSNTPSANANISVDYLLETPHAKESHHLSFIPNGFGVVQGSSVMSGADVGTLALTLTESQNNGNCSSAKFLSFTLLNASTNTADTISDTPRIPSATWPGFLDTNPANSLPDAVDKYPSFLNTLFPGLTPRARSFAWVPSNIATVNRSINVLVFEPGTALPGMSPIPASLGYIVVIVEQDPTAPIVSGATITDSCSEYHWVRTDRGITANNPDTAANEAGAVYRTNPAADGAYIFFDYGRSLRDLDEDGIENRLDTCPSVATPDWDPRSADPVDDVDADGIPGKDDPGIPGDQLVPGTGCDPTPGTANSDADGDTIVNRLDNCATVANTPQADPDSDGIGSSCDVVDTYGDGHLHEVCVSKEIDIGAGGSATVPACPVYVPDQDNDGYSQADEALITTAGDDPCGNDGWPADVYSIAPSANDIDVQDIGSFVAPIRHLNTSFPDANYSPRWDIVPGSGPLGEDINAQDLSSIITLYPPMLEGIRAFNGPQCPYAP